ncbi:MAG: hypothetical protein V1743_00235 [Nanoarchaeota archaeon]
MSTEEQEEQEEQEKIVPEGMFPADQMKSYQLTYFIDANLPRAQELVESAGCVALPSGIEAKLDGEYKRKREECARTGTPCYELHRHSHAMTLRNIAAAVLEQLYAKQEKMNQRGEYALVIQEDIAHRMSG